MNQLSLWLLFAVGFALMFGVPAVAGFCVCLAVLAEMLFGDDDDFDDGDEVGVDVPAWRKP